MPANDDREYRVTMGRIRMALLTASGLSAAQRQIGLLMVEFVSRKDFLNHKIAHTWIGVDSLCRHADRTRSGVQTARKDLCKCGAITVSRAGGHGPRDTSVYRFNMAWVERVEAETAARSSVRAQISEPIVGVRNGVNQQVSALKTDTKGPKSPTLRAQDMRPEPFDINPMTEPLEADALLHAEAGRGFQDGDSGKTETVRQSHQGIVASSGFQKERALEWSETIDRMHRCVPHLDRRMLVDVLMKAQGDEIPELSRRTTSKSRLIEIVAACKERFIGEQRQRASTSTTDPGSTP